MSGVNNTYVFVISGKVNFLMIEVITKLSRAFKSKMFQHFFQLFQIKAGANREYGLKIGGSNSQGAMSRFLAWAHVKSLDHVSFYIYPCRPNSGRREKIKLDFYFHASFWCLKRFYEGPKGLLGHHKQGWK